MGAESHALSIQERGFNAGARFSWLDRLPLAMGNLNKGTLLFLARSQFQI
jgi:hypothetical protein